MNLKLALVLLSAAPVFAQDATADLLREVRELKLRLAQVEAKLAALPAPKPAAVAVPMAEAAPLISKAPLIAPRAYSCEISL